MAKLTKNEWVTLDVIGFLALVISVCFIHDETILSLLIIVSYWFGWYMSKGVHSVHD